MTQSDKKELTELLKELKEKSSEEDYLITLINLEELIGKFLTNELEDGNPVMPLTNELRVSYLVGYISYDQHPFVALIHPIEIRVRFDVRVFYRV